MGVIWGSPEVTPGGRALKFYSSVRIDLRRAESIKSGTDVVGNRVRARVVKNKVAAPFKVAEFDIMFNQGVSLEGDLLELGEVLDLRARGVALRSVPFRRTDVRFEPTSPAANGSATRAASQFCVRPLYYSCGPAVLREQRPLPVCLPSTPHEAALARKLGAGR